MGAERVCPPEFCIDAFQGHGEVWRHPLKARASQLLTGIITCPGRAVPVTSLHYMYTYVHHFPHMLIQHTVYTNSCAIRLDA